MEGFPQCGLASNVWNFVASFARVDPVNCSPNTPAHCLRFVSPLIRTACDETGVPLCKSCVCARTVVTTPFATTSPFQDSRGATVSISGLGTTCTLLSRLMWWIAPRVESLAVIFSCLSPPTVEELKAIGNKITSLQRSKTGGAILSTLRFQNVAAPLTSDFLCAFPTVRNVFLGGRLFVVGDKSSQLPLGLCSLTVHAATHIFPDIVEQQCPSLQVLSLAPHYNSIIAPHRVPGLANLETLEFPHKFRVIDVMRDFLKPFTLFVHLRCLNLAGCAIDSSQLTWMTEKTVLPFTVEQLSLESCVSLREVNSLLQWRLLRGINVNQCFNMDVESLAGVIVSRGGQLTELSLQQQPTTLIEDKLAPHAASFKRLTSLDMLGSRISLTCLAHLVSNLSELTKLAVTASVEEGDSESLSVCNPIEMSELTLHRCNLPFSSLMSLVSPLSRLTSFVMKVSAVDTPQRLEHNTREDRLPFTASTTLKSLYIESCCVPAEVMLSIAALTNLTALDLSDVTLRDNVSPLKSAVLRMEFLYSLRNLTRLVLSGFEELSSETVSRFSRGLGELTHVSISQAPMLADVNALAVNCPQLETLRVAQTSVADEGICSLGRLRKLSRLFLTSSLVTNVNCLKSCCSLRMICVEHTLVTWNGIKDIMPYEASYDDVVSKWHVTSRAVSEGEAANTMLFTGFDGVNTIPKELREELRKAQGTRGISLWIDGV